MAAPAPLEATEPGVHLNALRDLAHAASRAAAGALTRSLRRRVTVQVPEFAVSLVEQLPAVLGRGDLPVVAVTAQLLGDVSGPLAWIMSVTEARRLGGALLARDPETVAPGDGAVQAVLSRTAHTIAAAYADVLAALTRGVVFLSVPDVVLGPVDRVLIRRGVASDPRHPHQLSLCVGSRITFDDEGHTAVGHLVLMPHHPAFGRILRALRD